MKNIEIMQGVGLAAILAMVLLSFTFVFAGDDFGYDPETDTYLEDRAAKETPRETISPEALEDQYEESLEPRTINPSGNYFTGDGGYSGDFCTGCGDGDNPLKEIHIQDSSTVLMRFDDTGTAVSTWDIGIPSESHRFIIQDVLTGFVPFAVEEGAASDTLVIDGSVVGIGTSTPEDVVEGTGRSALFIEGSLNPGLILNQTGSGARKWMIFPSALDGGLLFGNSEGNNYDMVIEDNGNVGIGTTFADYKLEVNGTIYANSVEVASSRELKENIEIMDANDAAAVLQGLDPVGFNYKETPEKRRLGFIAEDVPDIVATKDRKGVSSIDIVAVLTSVVKQQQKTIAELSEKVAELDDALRHRPPCDDSFENKPHALDNSN